MAVLIIIGLIVVVILTQNQYSKLKKENKELRERLNQKVEHTEQVKQQENIVKPQAKTNNQQKTITREQFEMNEKNRKNATILITGAICIILAAIVFLTSTWSILPNLFKTIVLVLVTFVFYGGSYISDKKFKLEKTSKTFFYIAMAYIPICLLSISVLRIFGDYLSIYGEGKWIYFTGSAIFLAVIYYAIYSVKNNQYLLIGSVLSQMFGVIAVVMIFSNDAAIIGISLLLYNILLMTLTKKEIFKKIYNIIPIFVTIVSVFLIWNHQISVIFTLLLLAINYYILNIKQPCNFNLYMSHIILFIFGAYTAHVLYFNGWGMTSSCMVFLAFVMLVYFIENLLLEKNTREKYFDCLSITTIATIALLHLFGLVFDKNVTSYIASICQIIVLVITYLQYKKSDNKDAGTSIISILIPAYFIVTGLNIINVLNCSYHIYIIFSILTFIISELIKNKDKYLHLRTLVVSCAFIILTYIITFATNGSYFANDIVYSAILLAVFCYCYKVYNNSVFKYITYIISNFVVLTFAVLFTNNETILFYIPAFTTAVIAIMEMTYKKLQDKISDIYLIFAQLASFGLILIEGTTSMLLEESTIAIVAASVLAIIVIISNMLKNKEEFNVVPLLCMCPFIYSNGIYAMLIWLFATSVVSVAKKEVSVYTIFSAIYLIITIVAGIENKYISEILFVCWALTHYMFISSKLSEEKDAFKFLTYLSFLFIYNSIIKDFGIQEYTAVAMLGYITIAVLTFKTILNKYVEKTDNWEYVVFAAIYIISLFQYNDELDGILFGVLIVALMIISYMKKYGAIFMVSATALIVNVFALTREFWFSLPWWAYLLTIGLILIAFAIRNEVKDKKDSKNIADVLKGIKDNIDK